MTEVKARLAGRLSDFVILTRIGSQLSRLPTSTTVTASQARVVPRWAVISAGLSPVVLTSAWVVSDALQPASYSPMRQTISVLAGQDGTDRWLMTGALFLIGGCYLATAAGLGCLQLPGRSLLVLAGLCSIGVATSPEPATGPTLVHLAWTVIGGIAIAVWPAVASWSAPPDAEALRGRGAALATVVFLLLLAWVVVQTQGGNELGLAERMASSVPTTWPWVVALLLRRSQLTGASVPVRN
jgi:hypothetical membrane protein